MGHSVTDFANSQWFTRGWTLQELLAPRTVVFLSKQWQELGQKSSLACIADITGIPALYVNGVDRYMLADISAAEKFGWAAKRQTSRKEDQAYCLLGLFDVSMPLLYGEGDKAFRRLQRKILKSSKDKSIFLWDKLWAPYFYHGLLAESIGRFARPLDKLRDPAKKNLSRIPGLTRSPYLVTNKGLQFYVPRELARKQGILLPLNCRYISQDGLKEAYAIRLEKINDEGRWANIFSEDWPDGLPAVNCDVRRVPGFSGLFLVSVDWVWSREELSKRGSEVVYMVVDEFESQHISRFPNIQRLPSWQKST